MIQPRGNYANIPKNVYSIMNVTTTQHCGIYVNIPMNVYSIMNVTTTQHCGIYVNIPMNVSSIINVLMVQRRRCCSFDSPGLARNEPTPGQRLQGDSTP